MLYRLHVNTWSARRWWPGLKYHFGLFHQRILDRQQTAVQMLGLLIIGVEDEGMFTAEFEDSR